MSVVISGCGAPGGAGVGGGVVGSAGVSRGGGAAATAAGDLKEQSPFQAGIACLAVEPL